MVEPRRGRRGRVAGKCNHETGKAQVFRLSGFISNKEKELRVQFAYATAQGLPICMVKRVATKDAVLGLIRMRNSLHSTFMQARRDDNVEETSDAPCFKQR
jgi:hypothetical protein